MIRPCPGQMSAGIWNCMFPFGVKAGAVAGEAFRITQRFDMAVLPKYGRSSYAENGRKERKPEKSGKNQKR